MGIFKYLVGNDSNKIKIAFHVEIKTWLSKENVCYHSVQNILFSHWLSKNVNMQNYNSYFSFVQMWNLVSHTKESHKLRTYENKLSRIIFRPKRDEVTERWRKCIMRCCRICIPPNIIRMIKSRRMRCSYGRYEKWIRSSGQKIKQEGLQGRQLLDEHNIVMYPANMTSN
jgi:hypothetical protein